MGYSTGYRTTIDGIELELRLGSVVIVAPDDVPEWIDGDTGRVDINGEFLAEVVAVLRKLGIDEGYDRGRAVRAALRAEAQKESA